MSKTIHRVRSAARAAIVLLVALGAGLAMVSCSGGDDPKAVVTSTTRPATRPATASAAGLPTQPASRPTLAALMINGQRYEFPRARLRLVERQPAIVLRLFSDDPPQAINEGYTGHSFYFEIKLDTDDLDRIAAMDWEHRSLSASFADSSNGVFLDGNRRQLQPYEVRIELDGTPADMLIGVHGRFLLFNARDHGGVGEMTSVHGLLRAELEMGK
jgi:hypothetical protein